MLKSNFYQAREENRLDKTIKLNATHAGWEEYDLSSESHQRSIAAWKEVHQQTPKLARTFVQAQTLAHIRAHELEANPAKLVKGAAIPFDDATFFNTPLKFDHQDAATGLTVKIKPRDCLYAARSLVRKGKRVLVLNMANEYNVGGGYKKGCGAQEENIFRRSNLVNSLSPHGDKTGSYLGGTFGEWNTLYSDEITVFRRGENDNYAFLNEDEYFTISVVSSAAYDLNYPKAKMAYYTDREDYLKKMEKKIVMQLETAISEGHRHLILSAYGCGAFLNDPVEISELYRKILKYPRYLSAFEYVEFAIIPNPGSDKDNFTPFVNTFLEKKQTSSFSYVPLLKSVALGLGLAFAATLLIPSYVLPAVLGLVAGFAGYRYLFSHAEPKTEIPAEKSTKVTLSEEKKSEEEPKKKSLLHQYRAQLAKEDPKGKAEETIMPRDILKGLKKKGL